MSPPELSEAVRHRAGDLGFDACRITRADPPASFPKFQTALAEGRHGEMGWLERSVAKRGDPQLILPGARSFVMVAVSYAQPDDLARLPAASQDSSVACSRRGIVARYAQYEDYHDVLLPRLEQLGRDLETWGGQGHRSLGYVDTGPILERDLAQRAGLGFVGKHTGLISRRLGNWFLLGEVLTTVELAPDDPETNRCGSCQRCLTACPTQALPAPFTLDARRCISYLTIEHKGSIPLELRPLIGQRIFGCDDCLAVCPWNRFARAGTLLAPHARPDLAVVDLVEWLSLDEPTFRSRFRGTPMFRTKRRGLLRNVCIALGNAGDPSALPALRRAASDPEPLIAEHAAWAIERLGSVERR